ncbi:hypothetical protein LIA77_10232 [Sarocladium implicatum]|nr:hypothetical protein LIA77_10232 [Sarocladium implicatum]
MQQRCNNGLSKVDSTRLIKNLLSVWGIAGRPRTCLEAPWGNTYRTLITSKGTWYVPISGELGSISDSTPPSQLILVMLGPPAAEDYCPGASRIYVRHPFQVSGDAI